MEGNSSIEEIVSDDDKRVWQSYRQKRIANDCNWNTLITNNFSKATTTTFFYRLAYFSSGLQWARSSVAIFNFCAFLNCSNERQREIWLYILRLELLAVLSKWHCSTRNQSTGLVGCNGSTVVRLETCIALDIYIIISNFYLCSWKNQINGTDFHFVTFQINITPSI